LQGKLSLRLSSKTFNIDLEEAAAFRTYKGQPAAFSSTAQMLLRIDSHHLRVKLEIRVFKLKTVGLPFSLSLKGAPHIEQKCSSIYAEVL
jgi:hypothetical protein